jgi:hypothetical protein
MAAAEWFTKQPIALPEVGFEWGEEHTCGSAVTKVTATSCNQHQSDAVELPRERAMPRSTSKSNPPKWVLALCREMQTSIGHQLQIEGKLPQELGPELSGLVARLDEEAVGTC